MSNQKDIGNTLEKLIEHIKTLNEILKNKVPEEIKKYKKEYTEAISLLGELNATLSK